MGRVYLPLVWLDEAKISSEKISAPENRDRLAMLTLRLPNEAECYYRSGDDGVWHLSFRSAFAVAAARDIYAKIGSVLIKPGAHAWDRRTSTTGARKVWGILRAVVALVRSAPARWFRPWSAGALRTVRKYSNVR